MELIVSEPGYDGDDEEGEGKILFTKDKFIKFFLEESQLEESKAQ